TDRDRRCVTCGPLWDRHTSTSRVVVSPCEESSDSCGATPCSRNSRPPLATQTRRPCPLPAVGNRLGILPAITGGHAPLGCHDEASTSLLAVAADAGESDTIPPR